MKHMTKPKTLGQIAWEAIHRHNSLLNNVPWNTNSPGPCVKAMYENMANAVAREVKRRLQKEPS